MGNILDSDNTIIDLPELIEAIPIYPAHIIPNEEPCMSALGTLEVKSQERKRECGQEHCMINVTMQTQKCSIKVQEDKYIVRYPVERCGDLVSNFHLVGGPIPYPGLERVRLRTMYGKQVLETKKIIQGVSPVGELVATNTIFPIVSLYSDCLVLELEFSYPADVQAFLTRTVTLAYQTSYCSARLRKYMMNHPISVPDYDIVLYRGRILRNYRDSVRTPTHQEMRQELGMNPPSDDEISWEEQFQKTSETVVTQMKQLGDTVCHYFPLFDDDFEEVGSSEDSQEQENKEDKEDQEDEKDDLTVSQTSLLESKLGSNEDVVLFEAPKFVVTSTRVPHNTPESPKNQKQSQDSEALQALIDTDATDSEIEWDCLSPNSEHPEHPTTPVKTNLP